MQHDNILITICAKGVSRGIPGKNIKEMNGKPLIGYTIETAIKFAEAVPNVKIGLSTDSDEIKEVAASFGITTEYTRPDNLATHSAGKLPVIHTAMDYYEKFHKVRFEYVIDLDITSPLRTVEDITTALDMLKKHHGAVNLFSVSNSHRNPYFNMVEEQPDGFYHLVKKATYVTRQSSPRVYDLNASFYIFKRGFFDEYTHPITPKSIIYEVPHTCFDLDEPLDFDFLEYLLKHNKLNFEI